jgi:hypothetical protein
MPGKPWQPTPRSRPHHPTGAGRYSPALAREPTFDMGRPV